MVGSALSLREILLILVILVYLIKKLIIQAMESKPKQVLHMNGGEGENSYAVNSLHQRKAILLVQPIVEESIQRLFSNFSSDCFKMADLGCSSGPNATMVASYVIETVDAVCQSFNQKTPMFQIFLNDLPDNDFNLLFKSLPQFYARLYQNKGTQFGPCFVAAAPGSFYGRLFPDQSIHFFHSSYSLHWLSQVPKALVGKAAPVNKGNIVQTITSPESVCKAYLEQFEEDFTAFIRSRSEEIVPGGTMVLTVMARDEADDYRNTLVVLGMALNEMVSENLIEEAKLDSYNLPEYKPTAKEVRRVIEAEGSFVLDRLELLKIGWEASTEEKCAGAIDKRAQHLASCIRAVTEPMLRDHFGMGIMDELFIRYKKIASQLMETKYMATSNLAISLTRKI